LEGRSLTQKTTFLSFKFVGLKKVPASGLFFCMVWEMVEISQNRISARWMAPAGAEEKKRRGLDESHWII
jgi:hypothetical protein